MSFFWHLSARSAMQNSPFYSKLSGVSVFPASSRLKHKTFDLARNGLKEQYLSQAVSLHMHSFVDFYIYFCVHIISISLIQIFLWLRYLEFGI